VNAQLADLPTGVLVGVIVVGVIQVALDVIALVDLYRRPTNQVALGNKWIWVAIVLLVNLLGAIGYLVVGRKPASVAEVAPPVPSVSRTEGIADALYGRGNNGDGFAGAGPR